MSAPAAASYAAASAPQELPGLTLLQQPLLPLLLGFLALGEMVADKLPFLPSRTAPAPFAARIVSGIVSGATVASRNSRLLAGLAGAAGAVAGTLLGSRLRSELAKKLHHDFPAAVIEDLLVLVLLAQALRGLGSPSGRKLA